jgi:hypothetical protein
MTNAFLIVFYHTLIIYNQLSRVLFCKNFALLFTVYKFTFLLLLLLLHIYGIRFRESLFCYKYIFSIWFGAISLFDNTESIQNGHLCGFCICVPLRQLHAQFARKQKQTFSFHTYCAACKFLRHYFKSYSM